MKYQVHGFKRAFFVVLAAALVVAAGSVLYWRQISQRLEQDARIALRADGQEITATLNHLFEVQLQVLTTLAVSLEYPEDLEDKDWVASYLGQQNKRNSFEWTGFQFPDGETVFSNGSSVGNFLSTQEVADAYEHSHYISRPRSNPFNHEKVFVLAVPVQFNREPLGVVFAVQPVRFYEHALSEGSLGNNGISMLLDDSGEVLVSYPQAKVNNIFKVAEDSSFDKGFSSAEIKQDMKQGRSGMNSYTLHGQHRFSSYFPLGYNNWYVMLVLPTSSVANKVQSMALLSLVLCFSVVVVLALLLVFIMRMQYTNAKEMYKLGFIDPLTKTDNLNAFRMKFPAVAAAFKEKNIPFALVLMNINRFKAVNDIYGFEQGDLVLKQVATILENSLRAGELFCRSGADVFLLLLACPDPVELGKRIDTLVERAGGFCQAQGEDLPLSITCGVYLVEEDIPFYIMMDRANMAWASAKEQAGTNYAFYDREYLHRIVTERRIESSMEQALADGEFWVYLQPKCDFKTGRTVSAEALVRWMHPSQGIIAPDWFIPIFEKNGFILKLDWFILREVVAQLKKWKEENRPLVPIGVNFSRLHLDDEHFIDELVRITDEAGVPHHLLEIELTESIVFGNVERMKHVIDGLHANGFSVAMDDFGAGYSSLNVLKNLDFDCVKLDKEFLAKGEGNPRQRQIISGLVSMVKDLDTLIVAEGVETKEQAEFLSSIGCDMAQGYFYSRPLPIEEFEKRLQEEIQ